MTTFLAAIIILLASFLFAMLGLGGGMVYIPTLHWLGFDFKTVAIPLGLLLNGLNTSLALIPYSRAGLVDWKGMWLMGVAAVIGAPIGALVEPLVPHDWLVAAFAAAVIAAAIRMTMVAGKPDAGKHITMPLNRRMLWGGISGLGIGFLGGMLGIGGGFIIVPLLMWMGYPTKQAAATTAMVVTFSSFSGFLGHMAHGQFPPGITVFTAVAVLLGSQFGARFMMHKAKTPAIKKVYAVVLFLISAKLLWEVGGNIFW